MSGQRVSVGLLVAVVAIGIAGWPQEICPLEAQGAGAGSVAIHFYGTRLDISFETELTIAGFIMLDGEAVAFEAIGGARGQGEGDSGTLEATVWSTMEAEGTLETGESINVRGGISVDSRDVDISTATAGAGTGLFYLVIAAEEWELHFVGEVAGDASGGFVPAPPDDPYAMVYAGDYTFDFLNAALVAPGEEPDGDPQQHVPWDLAEWPEELSAELLLLLEPPPEEGDTDDPPDTL